MVTEGSIGDPAFIDVLFHLVRAAMAGGSRTKWPWHLVAVRDREALAQIPALRSCDRMLTDRFTVIFVCHPQRTEQCRRSPQPPLETVTANLLAETTYLGLSAISLSLLSEDMQGFPQLPCIPVGFRPSALIVVRNPIQAHEAPPEKDNP